MQLLVFLLLCWMTLWAETSASDAQKPADAAFLPRYTLLAESKKKDQDLDRQPQDVAASDQQPWRRLALSGLGNQHSSWPVPTPAASLTALLGPGLLLLGVNLGALLYMLLGLLGLAPPQRFGPCYLGLKSSDHTGAWLHQDIYRNDRQHVGGGKDLDMYL